MSSTTGDTAASDSNAASVELWISKFFASALSSGSQTATSPSFCSSSSSSMPFSGGSAMQSSSSAAVESKLFATSSSQLPTSSACNATQFAPTAQSPSSSLVTQDEMLQFFASAGAGATLGQLQHERGHCYDGKKRTDLRDLSTLAHNRQYCTCNNAQCAQSRAALTESQCLSVRTFYADLGTEAARLTFLESYCVTHLDGQRVHYAICEQPLCYKAFCHIIGCSPGKLFHARAMAIQHSHPVRAVESRAAPKADATHAWLAAFFDAHCDKPSADKWFIPDWMNWEKLYAQFFKENPNTNVHESTFQTERRTRFPNVHKRRADDFAHCSECIELDERCEHAVPMTPEALAFEKERDRHHHLAGGERRLCTDTAELARQGKCFHEYVDCSKSLPLSHEKHKPQVRHLFATLSHLCFCPALQQNVARLSGLEIALAGSLESGTNDRRAWFNLHKYKKDSNLVMNYVFWHTLALVVAAGAAAAVRAAPRLLVLQMDSAWGENKNRWMIGLAAYMIALGWFDRVRLHFLVQGHTHDWCDQVTRTNFCLGFLFQAVYVQMFSSVWQLIGDTGIVPFDTGSR